MSAATDRRVLYREAARSYLSTGLLLALMVVGFFLDLALGGAATHAGAWLVAAVLVCGIDALTVYAARTARSITVTPDEVKVGGARLDRSVLSEQVPVDETSMRVLGRSPGSSLPRGVPGLGVRTSGGAQLILPTRTPVRLAAVLGLLDAAPAEVRPARPEELALLPDVEDRSGTLFRVAGLELPDEAMTEAEFAASAAVLVVGEPPVGFAALDVVDGQGYLHQLSVLPGAMRQGHGTRLIDAAVEWARAQGHDALTLTTFRDVSFNGPYYERRGFVELAEPGPELRAIRDAEAAAGLDAISPRVAMIRRFG